MADDQKNDCNRRTARPGNASGQEPRVINSASLFGDRREVEIRHRGEIYRLRVTRNGKLILNK